MGFVIELTNKAGDPPLYVCAVPVSADACENRPTSSLDEARLYPYPTEEVAASVVAAFPTTKNVSYRVIAVDDEKPDGRYIVRLEEEVGPKN